ncbi:MAG: F420H2 dehydrogenase subunit FpoO [Methanohalobium sp.]|uniref:F420H2 dehydrogenase subunit FpoO n=1 Tax=Methanohalobium sp. TaxID=2837493 RepID=UPI00397E327E
MADCDLCGKSIPTLCPVKVLAPKLIITFPEGVWKGLCPTCVKSAEDTYSKLDQSILTVSSGKCNLCGKTSRLYPVEIQIPSFREGIDKEKMNLCRTCLEACHETHDKYHEKFEEAYH